MEYERETLGLKYQMFVLIEWLRKYITCDYKDRIAVTTSCGIDSAVLLFMVTKIDPAIPVFFGDTGMHFPETLAYMDTLVDRFKLTNIHVIQTDPEVLRVNDPESLLWRLDTDACCDMRKVEPLRQIVGLHAAWITGRKRYQGGSRKDLSLIEDYGDQIKINPLACMKLADIRVCFDMFDLPRHPLADRYTSIGCRNCTKPNSSSDPDKLRDGRWPHVEGKNECGLHTRREP